MSYLHWHSYSSNCNTCFREPVHLKLYLVFIAGGLCRSEDHHELTGLSGPQETLLGMDFKVKLVFKQALDAV